MKIFKNNFCFIILIAIAAATVFVFPASASTTDGAIDSTYKYAWGENIGWINFGTSEGNVHITDSVLTGYAWGENIGWISLNCSNANSCGTVDYKVSNDGAGNLSGYAWSENAGWLNFNPTYGGVTINSSGEFLGYAWGENIGWIVFNCATTNSCAMIDYKVKTDWRSQAARPACNNSLDDDGDGKTDYPNDPGCDSLTDDNETDSAGGGLPREAYNPPIPPSPTPENPERKFSVIINNGDKHTNSQTVKLKLNTGSNTQRMSISNSSNFENADQVLYQENINWKLSSCHCEPQRNNLKLTREEELNDEIVASSCGTPHNDIVCAVYVKFYTVYGVASEIVSDSIILVAEESSDFEKSSDLEKSPSSSEEAGTIETEILEAEIPKPEIPKLPKAPEQLPAQPLEQQPTPPSSEPLTEEPKTPPSFFEPSSPPEPTLPSESSNFLEETEKQPVVSVESPKQPSAIGGLWQSVKMAFKNIFGAIADSFNNAGKKIANLLDRGQNSFAVFVKDAKTLGSKVKIAVFESSNSLQISDVKVVSISSTSVNVIWQTNHKATSKVNYGLSRIYDREKQESKKVKNHSIILTNLNSNATYHYEVISQNGSYVYDADRIFVTAEE